MIAWFSPTHGIKCINIAKPTNKMHASYLLPTLQNIIKVSTWFTSARSKSSLRKTDINNSQLPPSNRHRSIAGISTNRAPQRWCNPDCQLAPRQHSGHANNAESPEGWESGFHPTTCCGYFFFFFFNKHVYVVLKHWSPVVSRVSHKAITKTDG